MGLFSNSRLTPIGIDIGTRSIKAAQLEIAGDRTRVAGLAHYALPATIENPKDRLKAVHNGLTHVQRSGVFRGRDVVLALNAHQLFVQNVRVPRLPDEELTKVIRWEAEERLPEDFGEAEVRHLIAGDIRAPASSGEGSEIRREVIVLACRRNDLQEIIALLETLKLRPVSIDAAPCAMVRASSHMLRRRSDEQSAFLFIDIGASMTTAVVTRGHEILLIKPLPIGGQSMDKLLSRKLKLSVDDALLARQQWGNTDNSTIDPELGRMVGEAVRGEVETLAGELLMCIRYHSVTFRGNRIVKTLLFGGEGNPRLAEQLSARIDIPCELADPFLGLEVPAHLTEKLAATRSGQWVVALGLCAKAAQAAAA